MENLKEIVKEKYGEIAENSHTESNLHAAEHHVAVRSGLYSIQ